MNHNEKVTRFRIGALILWASDTPVIYLGIDLENDRTIVQTRIARVTARYQALRELPESFLPRLDINIHDEVIHNSGALGKLLDFNPDHDLASVQFPQGIRLVKCSDLLPR